MLRRLILPLAVLAVLLAPALPARATVMGVFPGDLIKLKNDQNPATHADEAVYYFDRDWFRRPFPNRKVFESWYRDFSGVKEITAVEMAEIKMGPPIMYRPGTRLIKIPSVPRVYAVEPNGVLRWITDEAVARELFGANWSKRVDDVAEVFFANYTEGAPLKAAIWPTGTVVRRTSDRALFVTDGLKIRPIPAAQTAVLRLNPADFIDVADLSYFEMGVGFISTEQQLTDSAQLYYLDTLPPPQLTFPAMISTLGRGTERPLYAFDLTAGAPLVLRQIKVKLSGRLWQDGQPLLSNLKFIDTKGENLFGSIQLSAPGAAEETVALAGAYTMNANTIGFIELRADAAAGWQNGEKLTVKIDRADIRMSEGTNPDILFDFFPRTALPTMTLTVK